MLTRTRTDMTSRRPARISNLSTFLAILNFVNSAALTANKYDHSAGRTLRKNKLTNLAVAASLSFQ